MSESEFNEIIYERDKLKEQNKKLKEALKSITLSVSVHYDCTQGSEFQHLVNIAFKALKSCEP